MKILYKILLVISILIFPIYAENPADEKDEWKSFLWEKIEFKHRTLQNKIGIEISCFSLSAAHEKHQETIVSVSLQRKSADKVNVSFFIFDSEHKANYADKSGSLYEVNEIDNWFLVIETVSKEKRKLLETKEFALKNIPK